MYLFLNEKVTRLNKAKQRILDLRSDLLWHMERRDTVSEINKTIRSLNKAYIKYNQLRLKYWM